MAQALVQTMSARPWYLWRSLLEVREGLVANGIGKNPGVLMVSWIWEGIGSRIGSSSVPLAIFAARR